MARRDRSFPRRQLTADRRRYFSSNRWRLIAFGAVYLGLGVAVTITEFLLLGHGPLFWYAFGVFHAVWLALLIGALVLMWLTSSPKAIHYLRGAFGEDNTTDVLKSARRTTIWGFVAGVETLGGDIDHLVVTRSGGVLAIDSKWCNKATPETLGKMAESARSAARRAESVIRSENVGTLKRDSTARHRIPDLSYRVRPVVVVWGAERHRMPESQAIAGVDFISGQKLAQWLRSLEGQNVDRVAAKDLLTRLTDFKNR